MNISVVILAAGKGTRMKSKKAKVLHQLFFKPMVNHVIDALSPLNLAEIIVVTGHGGEEVEKELSQYNIKFARQKQQLGTGDAVKSAQNSISKDSEVVLVLCGDTPLIKTDTIQNMIESYIKSDSNMTVMTTLLDDPTNYGRIISDSNHNILRIVEEKDATQEERLTKEVNAGVYCVNKKLLFSTLNKVDDNNKQGEIYLTDIVKIAGSINEKVSKFVCPDSSETIGVNSRLELFKAGKILQQRRNVGLMESGVTIEDSSSTFIDYNSSIGKDSIIRPNVYISGKTNIGEGCVVNPFSKINDCDIGDGGVIPSFSNLKGKQIV